MDNAELAHRFAFHPPPHAGIARAHEDVRSACGGVALFLNETLPDGREKSTAIAKLDETMMWANAALARDPGGVSEPYAETTTGGDSA